MNKTNTRIPERDDGIDGDFNVEVYNQFQRNFRDKGILATDSIIKSGISQGTVLEIGPGPGYLGLEWLKKTSHSILTAVEISEDMISIAKENSMEYGLEERTQYVLGEAERMPFDEANFDAVFSNGSLHEWSDSLSVFREIFRVLEPGGRFFISDLRRDVPFPNKWLMYKMIKPPEIRPGFLSSVDAAYTVPEIRNIIGKLPFTAMQFSQNPFGLQITGIK